MGWKVFVERFDTGDLDGTNYRYYQPFIPNDDIILYGVRVWLGLVNDPALTTITMKLRNSSGVVIASSTTTYTKAELLLVEDNCIKEAYFAFNKINLKSTETYHVSFTGTGYTGTTSSYFFWKKSYPDPVYRTGLNITYPSWHRLPYDVYFIGTRL